MLTANTSAIPSCWPWSYSESSRPVQRAPLVAILIPISRRCVRSCQPSNFGPAITTLGRSSIAASKASSAPGAGAQSSWRIQSHSFSIEGGSFSTADATAAPKPVSRDIVRIGMRAPFSNFADESTEPVSTATI